MTEHLRQPLHVVIALGTLAVIRDAGPRANAVDLPPLPPTRRPRAWHIGAIGHIL